MADYSIPGASAAQNQLLNEIAQSLDVSNTHLSKVADDVYAYITSGLESPTQGPASWVSYIDADIAQDIRAAAKKEEQALGMTINTQAGRLKISSVKFIGGERDINKQ
ncbi:hypothetical protein H4S07_007044, partial [Coemansia furcata]